jgi:hypothetical protein
MCKHARRPADAGPRVEYGLTRANTTELGERQRRSAPERVKLIERCELVEVQALRVQTRLAQGGEDRVGQLWTVVVVEGSPVRFASYGHRLISRVASERSWGLAHLVTDNM